MAAIARILEELRELLGYDSYRDWLADEAPLELVTRASDYLAVVWREHLDTCAQCERSADQSTARSICPRGAALCRDLYLLASLEADAYRRSRLQG